jgi:small conductance mechanosensitive channel
MIDNSRSNGSKGTEETTTLTKGQAKKSIIQWVLILGVGLAAVLATTTLVLQPLVPKQYLIYLHVAEVVIIGYFIIHIFSNIFYKLALDQSSTLTANSIKSLVRIVGAMIIIAVIISYLAQDPMIAASISTISGLVIGFASSNLIGNAIAGLYLAITRPFRIGETIKVFGQTGRVIDISLLHTRLILSNGNNDDDNNSQDEMLVSNSSMVSTWVVLIKGEKKLQQA